MRDVFVRLLAEQYAESMSAIRCPVDLVWGEQDTEVPLEVAVRAQPMFPSATLVTLPGVGHLVPTEAPRELRRVSPRARSRQLGAAAGGRRRRSDGRLLVSADGRTPIVAVDLSRFHHGVAWVTVACCVAACVPGRPALAAGGPARALPGRIGRPGSPSAGGASTPANRRPGRRRRGRRGGSVRVAGRRSGGRRRGGRRARSACPLRGRTSPLAWTRRLRTLAAVWAVLEVVVVVIGVVIGLAAPLAVVAALAVPAAGRPGLPGDRPARAPAVRPTSSTRRRPGCAGWHRPWWPSPAPTARPRPRATSPTWSGRPARWWPPRPASTTGPVWPGPSTSTWPTAPRCSWPRWAPTARGRSPTCAAGARPTSP